MNVAIPDDVIQKAAEADALEAFEPRRYATQSPGRKAIFEAVERVIASLDLTEMVKAAVSERVGGVVRDIVDAEIQKAARQKVKAMRAEGTLFGEGAR